MPTYDYACAACGHRFERFESIHDEGAKACPKCGKRRARRRIGTGAGLIFKGSGFYTTDSRPPSKGQESAEPKKSEPDAKKPEPKEKKKEEKEHKK